ncbi:MAG: hypothetical protein ACRC0L_09560, partial [Angustibacter sp.]
DEIGAELREHRAPARSLAESLERQRDVAPAERPAVPRRSGWLGRMRALFRSCFVPSVALPDPAARPAALGPLVGGPAVTDAASSGPGRNPVVAGPVQPVADAPVTGEADGAPVEPGIAGPLAAPEGDSGREPVDGSAVGQAVDAAVLEVAVVEPFSVEPVVAEPAVIEEIAAVVRSGLAVVSPEQLSGQGWVGSRPGSVELAAAVELLGRVGRVAGVLDGRVGQFGRAPGAVLAHAPALSGLSEVGERALVERLLGSPLVRVAAMYRDLRGDALDRGVVLRELFDIGQVSPVSGLPAGPRLTVALLNPQGNFDTPNTGLGDHADFGGQLIYVRELAVSLAKLGMLVQIITRRIDLDPRFPKWGDRFAQVEDGYRDEAGNVVAGVSIVRLDAGLAGPQMFMEKEQLWEHLDGWVDRIV